MSDKRVLVFAETALALSETFIAAHCRSLRAYEYKLLALHKSGDHHRDVKRDLLFNNGRPDAFNRLAFRLGFSRRLDTVIEEFRPHIIHAHYLTGGAFLTPYAARHGIPLVVTAHGHDVGRVLRTRSPYDQLYRLQRRRLQREASAVLPVSNFLRQRLIADGFASERTHTHYLGIQLPSGAPAAVSSNPPRIVFVGRLVAKKGLDTLLAAFTLVRASCPAAELHIVGNGPLRHLLLQSSNEATGVVWHGAQSPERTQQIMAGARLLTLPSRRAGDGDTEGFGLVLIEAQALGIPVVTSNTAATMEALLHGKTGSAVDPGSPSALADACLQLLNDPGLAARMGMHGRHWVQENFDINRQTAALEQLYDALLQPGRARGRAP